MAYSASDTFSGAEECELVTIPATERPWDTFDPTCTEPIWDVVGPEKSYTLQGDSLIIVGKFGLFEHKQGALHVGNLPLFASADTLIINLNIKKVRNIRTAICPDGSRENFCPELSRSGGVGFGVNWGGSNDFISIYIRPTAEFLGRTISVCDGQVMAENHRDNPLNWIAYAMGNRLGTGTGGPPSAVLTYTATTLTVEIGGFTRTRTHSAYGRPAAPVINLIPGRIGVVSVEFATSLDPICADSRCPDIGPTCPVGQHPVLFDPPTCWQCIDDDLTSCEGIPPPTCPQNMVAVERPAPVCWTCEPEFNRNDGIYGTILG